jgi:hypothetical protein
MPQEPQEAPALTAKAEPSKAFFIDMLTKDIALSVCILDLIDNSVHSLIAASKIDVSQHLISGTKTERIKAQIAISFNASRFNAIDDCGGISIKEAEEQVFLLGNPSDENEQTGLGVYGIGMKRAFFKIGKQIAFLSHTTTEELRIDIAVDPWKNTRVWSFPFTYGRAKKHLRGGTEIEITNLHTTVGEQFASKAFKSVLLDKISRAYALFLKAGLKISVSGTEAAPDFPELAASKDLRPVRQHTNKDGVDILIMAGLSPVADRKPRGWYVFCNGRLVLDADKTYRTGWGADSRPSFHAKYNHFLGYVYFRSNDVHKLPWTTTKDGVDLESPIYQNALAEMWVLSRPVLDFLNDLYPDVKEESEPEHTVFKEARAIAPQKIASRTNTAFNANVKKGSDDDLVSIQYKRSKKKLRKIKEALGRSSMSASRIGEYTFDWFYDRNCK